MRAKVKVRCLDFSDEETTPNEKTISSDPDGMRALSAHFWSNAPISTFGLEDRLMFRTLHYKNQPENQQENDPQVLHFRTRA